MEFVQLNRNIAVYGSYDLAVIGGGPAGVCAAISAARKGMRVLLVESAPALGGMATSALVGPFMTNYDRDGETKTVGGMFSEIVDRLVQAGGAIPSDEVECRNVFTSYIA